MASETSLNLHSETVPKQRASLNPQVFSTWLVVSQSLALCWLLFSYTFAYLYFLLCCSSVVRAISDNQMMIFLVSVDVPAHLNSIAMYWPVLQLTFYFIHNFAHWIKKFLAIYVAYTVDMILMNMHYMESIKAKVS